MVPRSLAIVRSTLRRHRSRALARAVAASLLVGLVSPSWASPVSAQTYPGANVSFYVTTKSTQWHYDRGCSLGTVRANGSAPQDGLVILAYGQTRKSGTTFGASMFSAAGGVPITTTEIEAAVHEFARGFWLCTGANTTAHVRIAVGTSNNFLATVLGDATTSVTNHGKAWADMVDNTNAGLGSIASQADVVGASDLEVSWSTFAVAKRWVDGYDLVNSWHMYDFGDAVGCPLSGSTATPGACNNGWTQDSVRYVAWGAPSAWPVPEIYHTDGSSAKRWQQVSKYSQLKYGTRMTFLVSLTQRAACSADPNCPSSTNNTAQQGWQWLYDRFNSDPGTAQTIRWATDIKWS